MLLDSNTAIKVSHDIAHDIEEFIGKADSPAKWARLVASAEEAPEGYVDFEFSDGAIARIPCAWTIQGTSMNVTMPSLTFRRGGLTGTWVPGTSGSAQGAVSGMISDVALILSDAVTSSILGASRNGTSRLAIEKAAVSSLAAAAISVTHAIMGYLDVSGTAKIVGGTFENITSPGSYVDANADSMEWESADVGTLECTGEIINPVLTMHSGSAAYTGAPEADYHEYIPYIPLDGYGNPLNGFDAPLDTNPFYPDWFYLTYAPTMNRPTEAWVPSLTEVSRACWRDSDGIYWHKVNVFDTTGLNFALMYPPPCRTAGTSAPRVMPPLKADADGLIITAGRLTHLYNTNDLIALRTRLSYRDNESWYLGATRARLRGPSYAQFVVKRFFTVVSGEITAVEYQLLPLGEVEFA